MKRLRLILVALAMVLVTAAVATEPSKTTVRYQGKKYYVHRVKEGDTIYSLSQVYGVSQESIIEVNGIKDNEIRLGSMLYVPHVEGNSEAEAEKEEKAQSKSEKKRGKSSKIVAQESDVHIVVAGETLYSLSRKYGLAEQELLDLNSLKDHTDIKAGMMLRVKKGADDEARTNEGDDLNSGGASGGADSGNEVNVGKEGVSSAEGEQSDNVEANEALQEAVEAEAEPAQPAFTAVTPNTMLRVTLLLPFHARGEAKENIVDFYRGVLLAMEDLKSAGYSIELTVLDTKRNAEHISDMIEYGELDTQLIIGPVYSEEFSPLLAYAEERNIPVVSPLQYVDYASPVLFNMPAPQSLKGEGVAGLLDGSREVVKIYASNNDSAFINEVNAIACIEV